MKKTISIILSVLLLAVMLAACGRASDPAEPSAEGTGATAENPHVWKTGTSAGLIDGEHVIWDFLSAIKTEVEASTEMRYQLDTYHSSQLGSDRDMLEGTVMGTYQFALVPGTFISAYVDEFNAYEFPFLYDNEHHFFRTINSDLAQELGKKLEEHGLVWLGNGMNGILTISNSTRDIRKLEDFRGLKIRTIDSPIQVGAVNLLGANGTVVNWGETYTALQQHTIDGVITTGSGFLSGKIYEVNKYHTAFNMFYTPITAVVNKVYWDSLPKADQDAIRAGVQKAIDWHISTAVAGLDKHMQRCIDLGPMSSVKLEEFDTESAKAAVMPLFDEYPQYSDIFKRIASYA